MTRSHHGIDAHGRHIYSPDGWAPAHYHPTKCPHCRGSGAARVHRATHGGE